jgi:hypothetical protein
MADSCHRRLKELRRSSRRRAGEAASDHDGRQLGHREHQPGVSNAAQAGAERPSPGPRTLRRRRAAHQPVILIHSAPSDLKRSMAHHALRINGTPRQQTLYF